MAIHAIVENQKLVTNGDIRILLYKRFNVSD